MLYMLSCWWSSSWPMTHVLLSVLRCNWIPLSRAPLPLIAFWLERWTGLIFGASVKSHRMLGAEGAALYEVHAQQARTLTRKATKYCAADQSGSLHDYYVPPTPTPTKKRALFFVTPRIFSRSCWKNTETNKNKLLMKLALFLFPRHKKCMYIFLSWNFPSFNITNKNIKLFWLRFYIPMIPCSLKNKLAKPNRQVENGKIQGTRVCGRTIRDLGTDGLYIASARARCAPQASRHRLKSFGCKKLWNCV